MLTRGRWIALVLAGAFLALGVVVGGRMTADAGRPPRDTTPITVTPGATLAPSPSPSPTPTTTTGSITPELRDDDDDDGPDEDDDLRDDDADDDGD